MSSSRMLDDLVTSDGFPGSNCSAVDLGRSLSLPCGPVRCDSLTEVAAPLATVTGAETVGLSDSAVTLRATDLHTYINKTLPMN